MNRILTHIIMTAVLCGLCRSAAAQDTITTRSGRQIPVVVQKMHRHRVSYLQVSGGDTSSGWRDLHFVRDIKFADGRRWPYPAAEKRRISLKRQDRLALTRNRTFGFIGVQILGDYGGPTAGAGYERFVGPRLRWSVGTTLSLFAMNKGGFGYKRYPASYTQLSGWYLSSDLQYHLPTFRRRVSMSVGLALPLGIIDRRDHIYDEQYNYLGSHDRKYFLASTEAVLALRIVSSRSFCFMARMSGGPVISVNPVFGGAFRAAFCIGFRH